jgi:hypothetical protein
VLINHTLNLGGAAIDRVGGMALIFALSHCPVHAEVPIGTGQRSGHCGGQHQQANNRGSVEGLSGSVVNSLPRAEVSDKL